jgi:catechol 2,3-dioxygenase-like lactoylglutathione lyase family enzyme
LLDTAKLLLQLLLEGTKLKVLQPARANTILYCRNWAATVAFYRDTLGLPVSFENDWFVEFHLVDSAYLSIAAAERSSIAAVAGQGITLAWQVNDLEDVHGQLQVQGVTVTPIRRRWGARVFYCHDPEGHRLEFWSNVAPHG